MISREVLQQTPEIITALSSLYFLLAFSLNTRKKIGARDKWTCQSEGCDDGTGKPKSYQNGWMVQAAHGNHNKENPDYDTEGAGAIACIECHLAQHIAAQGHAEDIGLCEQANDFAIRKLKATDQRTIWWRREHGSTDTEG